MARIRRQIPTRGYEADATRSVPPSFLLRYMEHLRWEAIAEEMPGFGQLFHDGNAMVVAAQALELERPLRQLQALEAEMWIGRVGRSSLEFRHRFWLEQGEQALGRGRATVVYLGPDRRPRTLPAQVRSQVACEAEDFQLCPQLPATPPPANARSWRFVVRPSEIDFLQHVNHASYLDYFDDARRLAALAGAFGPRSESAAGRITRLSIDYGGSAVLGDTVVAHSWALPEPRQLACQLRRQQDDALLCRARLEVESS